MKKFLTLAVLTISISIFVFYLIMNNRANIEQAENRLVAQTYCSGCHLFPEPETLPRRSWETLLAYMGFFLGVENYDYIESDNLAAIENVQSRYSLLRQENLFPSTQLISNNEWSRVLDYYFVNSPERSLPQQGKPIAIELNQFRSLLTSYRISPPVITTAVEIDSLNNRVYLGDSYYETITTLGSNGQIESGPRVFYPPVSPVRFHITNDQVYVGSIGDLLGSGQSTDRPGFIGIINNLDQGLNDASYIPILGNLPRLADFEINDIDGDGFNDLVTNGFGMIVGELAVNWGREAGGYDEEVLANRGGAVKSQIIDIDDDGRLDILVLFADALEQLVIYKNLGDRIFEQQVAFSTNPSYGHTYFEVHDFNNDGLKDLLVVNGDNVDSDPFNTLKNFHGIRIYSNQGGLEFVESYFYPMHGAFNASAEDFDLDGDLDIAGIAFYPDFSLENPESFVYLENINEGFINYTDDLANSGRWMTMDVGDINSDGYPDIVLGGSYIPFGMETHMEKFAELSEIGPRALILENIQNE